MAFEKAYAFLSDRGYADRVQTFDVSSATVELAAAALATEPARIAKSLTFLEEDRAIMVVCAGDGKVNSGKFKQKFGVKARMLTREQVHDLVGHDVGGVCPFALPENVKVYLDVSLQRFDTVFPAAGSDNSAIEFTCEELEKYSSNFVEWVDVCKAWRPEEG